MARNVENITFEAGYITITFSSGPPVKYPISDFLTGAIATADLVDSCVTAAKLANSAVTADKIDTGAVSRSKLGADAVDGTKLADDAVAAEHIATLSELTVTSGNIPGQRFWVNHFYSFEGGHDDCHIFIATMACKVTAVRFVRSADEYGDLAVVITRTQSTEAPASGDEVVASTDLKALTKDTTTTGTVITAGQVNELAIGNRLSLNFTGTPYAIIGVITVEMEIMAA